MRKLIISLLLLTSACGGGGGSSSPQEAGAVNKSPIASAGVSQSIDEAALVTLNASGSIDSDGVIAAYSWVQMSNGAPTVILTGASSASCSFIAPDVSSETDFLFQVTVTDNEGKSSAATTTVSVRDVNAVPTGITGRTWRNSKSLETESGDVFDPIVQVNDSGIAWISWVQFDGTYFNLKVSKMDLDTEVQTNYGVVSSGTDTVGKTYWNFKYSTFPQSDLRLLDNGDVIVSYIDNNNSDVNVVVYTASSNTWSTPLTLDSDTTEARYPRVITNGTAALIAWFQEDAIAGTNLWVSSYDAGTASWEAAQKLDNASGVDKKTNPAEGELQGVMDSDGDVTLVWSGDTGSGTEDILVSRFTSGSWDSTVSIDNLTGEAGAPSAVVDSGGNVHVAWVQHDGIGYKIFYNKLTKSNETWATPEKLQDLGGICYPPNITARNQNIFVTWVRKNYDADLNGDVNVKEYDTVSGWLDTKTVTDLGRVLPMIDTDNQGGAMVIFYNYHTQFSTRNSDGSWSAVSKLMSYNDGEQHFMSLNDDGVGAAVWVAQRSGAEDLFLSIYK